jgi:uncharacterized membrane protein YidH (DUF202 family)
MLGLLLTILLPVDAWAYIGPGAGLSAIGTLLALLAVMALAVAGFVWYPVKRLMRRRKAVTVAEAKQRADSR